MNGAADRTYLCLLFNFPAVQNRDKNCQVQPRFKILLTALTKARISSGVPIVMRR